MTRRDSFINTYRNYIEKAYKGEQVALIVHCDVDLRGTNIKLPSNLYKVNGSLHLDDTSIQELPKLLTEVHGDFTATGTNITKAPTKVTSLISL